MWLLILLTLLILLAPAVFYLRRRLRTAFRIDIENGSPKIVRGQVDPQFIKDVYNICKLWGITSGTVLAMRTQRGLKVRCKGESLNAQQRAIQNALDYPL